MRRLLLPLFLLLATGCSSAAPARPTTPTTETPAPVACCTTSSAPTKVEKVELPACCCSAPTAVGEDKPENPALFVGDKGSRLVAAVLQPSAAAVTGDLKQARPKPLRPPLTVVAPQVPLAPVQLTPPHADPIHRALAQAPRPLGEGIPLAQQQDGAPLPAEIPMPATLLPRVPGPDPTQPTPVPVLAQPRPDRVPATDPAAPASLAAVLRESVPTRTAPAPFRPDNIPDPFPNRLPSQLRTVEGELTTPPVVALPLPGKK